ncbi:MAG: DUF932 domain-containing protein, partial [Lentisphaeria bacterium]|nr:DUF932 domain-containing protein [Lentisphaeria bacterium]
GRDELRHVPTPEHTKTWKPVSHYQAAELTVRQAERNGYRILTEEYGITPTGSRMFGLLRIHKADHPEFTRAIGIRNAHDKSLAFGITAGFSVMVCSNLCFSGELTMFRKHTSGINLIEMIPEAFEQLEEQYERLEDNIDRLKDERISERQAKLLTVKAAEEKVIPSCDIIPVIQAYMQPPHEAFEARNNWSLYNSFNEVAKKYSPSRADLCYRGLAKLFSLN